MLFHAIYLPSKRRVLCQLFSKRYAHEPTAHYSVAHVREIYDALERLTSETHRQNRSLAMIAREARGV